MGNQLWFSSAKVCKTVPLYLTAAALSCSSFSWKTREAKLALQRSCCPFKDPKYKTESPAQKVLTQLVYLGPSLYITKPRPSWPSPAFCFQPAEWLSDQGNSRSHAHSQVYPQEILRYNFGIIILKVIIGADNLFIFVHPVNSCHCQAATIAINQCSCTTEPPPQLEGATEPSACVS